MTVDLELVRRLAEQGDQPEPLFSPNLDEMPSCTGCSSPLCPDHTTPTMRENTR